MGKVWSAMVVYVGVAQVHEHVLEYTTAEVLVNAVAKVRRDIANNAPEYRKRVGVGVVQNVVLSVDVFEDDEPNIKWEGRCRHPPAEECFKSSASRLTICGLGWWMRSVANPCCCASS